MKVRCIDAGGSPYVVYFKRATALSLIAAARELEARWTPVTERRPERGESNLLFLSRTSTVRQGFRTSGVLYFLDDGDPATGVTHWMPLPKGPAK